MLAPGQMFRMISETSHENPAQNAEAVPRTAAEDSDAPAYPPDGVRPVAQAVQKHWNRRCQQGDTDGSNIEKLF